MMILSEQAQGKARVRVRARDRRGPRLTCSQSLRAMEAGKTTTASSACRD